MAYDEKNNTADADLEIDWDKIIRRPIQKNPDPELLTLSALMLNVSQNFQDQVKRVCAKNRIPNIYRKVLYHLNFTQLRNQKDLAAATGLRPSSVSVVVKQMEDLGMVKRVQNQYDLRNVNVELTDYGKELSAILKSKHMEMDAQATAGMTSEEIETLRNLLTRVYKNVLK